MFKITLIVLQYFVFNLNSNLSVKQNVTATSTSYVISGSIKLAKSCEGFMTLTGGLGIASGFPSGETIATLPTEFVPKIVTTIICTLVLNNEYFPVQVVLYTDGSVKLFHNKTIGTSGASLFIDSCIALEQ